MHRVEACLSALRDLDAVRVSRHTRVPLALDGQSVPRTQEEREDGGLAVVGLKSGQQTFKRVYFRAKSNRQGRVLDPIDPKYDPEPARRSQIERMTRISGAKS